VIRGDHDHLTHTLQSLLQGQETRGINAVVVGDQDVEGLDQTVYHACIISTHLDLEFREFAILQTS
jgi:hypothetical protein